MVGSDIMGEVAESLFVYDSQDRGRESLRLCLVWILKTLNPIPCGTPPPMRTHLLILSKLFHRLGTNEPMEAIKNTTKNNIMIGLSIRNSNLLRKKGTEKK